MSSRVTNENRSFHGSNVYLTSLEKYSLLRAIDQYIVNVEGTDEDDSFRKFFEKYDQEPLHSAYQKLIGKHKAESEG